MKVILATNNQDKVKEISQILNIFNWEFFSLKDLEIDSDPEETADSFLGNAKIKVDSALQKVKDLGLCDYAVIAEDSGLCVDALDGAPGLFSARFASLDGQHSSYNDNNEKLLHMLKDVADDDRTAHFETAAIIVFPNGKTYTSNGICPGKIAFEKKGTNGFGYDPIFLPACYNYKKSMAELLLEEKDKISHRSKALQKLKIIIEKEYLNS